MGATSITLGSKISRFFRGEIGIHGQKIYRPEFSVSPSNLQKVNFQEIHETLFVDWLLARSQGEPPSEIESLYQALTSELMHDKNLTAIVSEINRLLPNLKKKDAFERLTYLVWAWNDYLRQKNIKWMLDYSALQTEEDQINLFLLGYQVDSTLTGNVDGKAINVDFLTRRDGLNIKEKFLGITSEEEQRGRVIWNLCEEFTRESVWPAIVKSSGRKRSNARFIEDYLKDEINRALPKNIKTQLSTGADAFYKFQKTISTINKRDRCRLNFKIEYDSLEIVEGNYDTANLWAMFYKYETDRCKPVDKKEVEELVRLIESIKRLDMKAVFRAITNHVAQGVAVHELRHQGDFQSGYTDGSNCKKCPKSMYPSSKVELSAYIASFSHSETGMINLFQACENFSKIGGGYEQALGFLIPKVIGKNCRAALPANVKEKFQKFEFELFNRQSKIVLSKLKQ